MSVLEIIYKNIKDADVILEILDARDPLGTRNKEIEKKILEYDKILILVLNKADLVPNDVLIKWKQYLDEEFPTIYTGQGRKFELSLKLLKKEIKQRSKKEEIKILIIGYPNVGKSSLINALKGKITVGISPDAGFTRGKQYIRLSDDILLIDTPGVIPRDETDEVDLVLKDAMRVEKTKDPCLVVEEMLKRFDKKMFIHAYKIEFSDLDELLEKFARERGKLLPGNEPNVDEAARMIIRDWQRGKIRYYTLPPP